MTEALIAIPDTSDFQFPFDQVKGYLTTHPVPPEAVTGLTRAGLSASDIGHRTCVARWFCTQARRTIS